MNWSNQKMFIIVSCGALALMRRCPLLSVSILLSVFLAYIPAAHALGVGVAVSDSYIGQPLLVRIPLYDVDSPNNLSVRLLSVNGAEGRGALDVSISRDDSVLGVLISSSASVSEPYFQFTIEINDGGNVFLKEFTTLLNLAPNAIANPAAVDGAASRVSNPSDQVLVSNQVMGPYDWAKAGQVPERFGPVLDGQSLWRVARRINKALGVSVHQMMWALYEQNPQAFTTSSIESLSAGSYLTIPTYAQASAFSHQQAADRLNQLSSPSQLANAVPSKQAPVEATVSGSTSLDQASTETPPSESALNEELANAEDDSVTPTRKVVQDSFQLGGLDQANDNSNSTQIISSLAETVGNLTQELIHKDQQIRFLEQKVSSLEDLVYSGGAVELADERESALVKEAELLASIDEPVAEVLMPVEPESNAIPLPLDISEEKSVEEKPSLAIPIWAWLVIGLALLGALGVFFRERLITLYHSLNLFGSNDDIEFAATNYEGTEMVDPELYSLPQDMDSFMSFDEDETVTIMVQDEIADELNVIADDSADQSNLSFNERFERLIAIKDYAFARELLDSSRGNEVDDQLYHRNRLRLYEAMHDEDAFYNYYDEIEPQLPEFDPVMQNKISQLVIRLAQY